jgi:hypothetical protein
MTLKIEIRHRQTGVTKGWGWGQDIDLAVACIEAEPFYPSAMLTSASEPFWVIILHPKSNYSPSIKSAGLNM